MSYSSLKEACDDLYLENMLVKVNTPLDPDLEMAELHRRINSAGGPAILFNNVKGSGFKAVSNLFGTRDRAIYLLRDSFESVKKIISLKKDPFEALLDLKGYKGMLKSIYSMLPLKKKKGSVLYSTTSISSLPQIKCWPEDGGGFILLPQVYSENPYRKSIFRSNIGMYRVQLSGNHYIPDKEAGIHYQLERGIGIHHLEAIKKGEKLNVSIFVGGPPAHTLAAVMPLPHNLPEIFFAGALAGRRFRYARKKDEFISLDSDFCITGELSLKDTKKEGPFGDHLGYYSLKHDFPYLTVKNVYHRKDAIWPFTVVGRPPQEDSVFGDLIHELSKPAVSVSIPGVEKIHAVDVAGVHPLMFAIGHERYLPYEKRRPSELLNAANAILGFGQCSLSKYLFMAAHEDDENLDINNETEFLMHILERVDFENDLHFHTGFTMDTLDYSGGELNRGSKLVIAACGEKKRKLKAKLDSSLKLPEGFSSPHLAMPGVICIKGPLFNDESGYGDIERFCNYDGLKIDHEDFPLVVICDDPEFTARNKANFFWVAFTRSDPAHDVNGVSSFIKFKHFGCRKSLVIDARKKPHHAKELVPDEKISKKIDALFQKSGELYGLI